MSPTSHSTPFSSTSVVLPSAPRRLTNLAPARSYATTAFVPGFPHKHQFSPTDFVIHQSFPAHNLHRISLSLPAYFNSVYNILHLQPLVVLPDREPQFITPKVVRVRRPELPSDE